MNDDEIRRLTERLHMPNRLAGDAGDETDEAIPMLTEIVETPESETAAWQGAEPAAVSAPDAATEERIVARALECLAGDPGLLEAALRDAIDAATTRFAEQLATELRATLACLLPEALAPALREAVREAIRQAWESAPTQTRRTQSL